jgi:glutathione synthase/RimK-type ligase-like ATP-grasp enzyme
MKKLEAIILRNELEDDHAQWIKSCEFYRNYIEYRIIDLTTSDWLEEIQRKPFDILLAKPGGLTSSFKQLYDERIYILTVILGFKVFPSLLEILIYENKRFLSYWLKANKIPHPETFIFYYPKEALKFLEGSQYPLVAKSSIGASGSGIVILHRKKDAENYTKNIFSSKLQNRRSGPNLEKGRIVKRGLHYVLHPKDIQKKLSIYDQVKSDVQSSFVIFQMYVNHDYEWRVIRIGESYFAHKKLKVGEKASGTLIKAYDNPPLDLLDFVREITNKFGLYSQAIDIFESDKGYLVNEMQCIFGQSDPFQMLVDNKAGRYQFVGDKWIFEEGDFVKNSCFDLRIDYILNSFL